MTKFAGRNFDTAIILFFPYLYPKNNRMKNFVAIDFETANYEPTSICSVGLVVVRGGEITQRMHRLVCPEPNYYIRRFRSMGRGVTFRRP